tara:strand:+ start:76 stop:672 length:597 start_codon:yes stop_codon:yes gene_type:complete
VFLLCSGRVIILQQPKPISGSISMSASEIAAMAADGKRVFIIFGGQNCTIFNRAVVAAETLSKEFLLYESPIVISKPTTDEYQSWLTDRSNLPVGFKEIFPENHTTSPACFESTANGDLVFIGGYSEFAQIINVSAGGKLIAPTDRNDGVAVIITTIIFFTHVLLMVFLNPQPVAWRWTTSQTGAAVLVTVSQMYSKS